MKVIEQLMEIRRVTEWRDGAVYRTEYVEDRWITLYKKVDGQWLDVPLKLACNELASTKSVDFDGATIRTVDA